VQLNINAALAVEAEYPELSWKDIIAETTLHELLHAFQELFDRPFDEEEVTVAIERLREYQRQKEADEH
jgi:hypothetical protein